MILLKRECSKKGKNNSSHTGIPYLLKYSNEINILDDLMENRLGVFCTTSLI